jgi:ribonuclease HI
MTRPSKPHSPAAVLQFGKLAFGEPDRVPDAHLAYVDGASRGNPGPASYAVILRSPDGKTKFEIGKYLGRATNNVAEYYALITALDYASAEGISRLCVRSDSELLVRQMQGRYKVKSADLRPLYERAQKLARGLAYFHIEHVPREQNREADELANIALDNTSSTGARPVLSPAVHAGHGASPSPAPQPTPVSPPARPHRPERIRARYSAGALHPLEPLRLDEGEIVEIQVKKSDHS